MTFKRVVSGFAEVNPEAGIETNIPSSGTWVDANVDGNVLIFSSDGDWSTDGSSLTYTGADSIENARLFFSVGLRLHPAISLKQTLGARLLLNGSELDDSVVYTKGAVWASTLVWSARIPSLDTDDVLKLQVVNEEDEENIGIWSFHMELFDSVPDLGSSLQLAATYGVRIHYPHSLVR
jgi:hypothetical protein